MHGVMEGIALGVPGRREQVVRKAWSHAWQEKARSRPGELDIQMETSAYEYGW